MDAQDTFGQWIKQRRKELDLTQEELAGIVSCSPVMIKKIEANERRPSKQMVGGLARALQIATADVERFLAKARGTISQEFALASVPPLFDTQIPLPGASFVKRPTEIASICSLLRRPDVRLLTLTGPGGVGKTRLAIQAAQELQGEFTNGAHLIDLAPVFQPELLLTTIALGLGLSAPDERTASERLSGYFQDKQVLLVLDNFEQILESAPQLAAWLATTTGLKILVTSRARLRLSVEHEYPVPPMKLPDLHSLPTPEELLAQYPAMELFTLRVRAIQPAFQLTGKNAPAVAEICTLLDGLPLAIELAAARCNLLDPLSLLERLHYFHPLQLLTGGAQDSPARQQTLQRTIDWSYSFLSGTERLLFERLGVFVGGATLEAIESICSDPGNLQVLNSLQALMDHSLIWRSVLPTEAPRFQMLATLREYAFEHLVQRGELDLCRHKHAAYFEAWAAGILLELRDSRQVAAVLRLEADLDNLRAALEWCCSVPADLEIGMRLAGRFWEFWLMHGDIEEGQAWILRLLAVFGQSEPTIWQAHMLNGLGILANESGQYSSGYFNESLAIFRKLGDRYGEAWVLNHLGQIALETGLFKQSSLYLEESLRLFLDLNADWNTAWVLHNLAALALHSGDLSLAESTIQQCLQLFLKTGDQRGVALSHSFSGELAQRRGDLTTAIQSFTEAVDLFRQTMDFNGVAWRSITLGNALMQSGDAAAATRCLLESLRIFRRKGDLNLGVAYSLIGLAQIGLKNAAPEQAVSLLGAASALLKQSDTYNQEFERGVYSPIEREMRQRLGQEKFDRLWRDGQQAPVVIVNLVDKGSLEGFGG